MSIATLILGESGTGKTTSLRNLDPAKVLLLQTVRKPLPFKSKAWDEFNPETKTGTIFCTRNPKHMIAGIKKASEIGKEIIIIDDWQYQMAGQFMDKSAEKGFDKFTELAKDMWEVAQAAISADSNLRVYFLTHSQSDEYGGNVRMKTLGKLLQEKLTIEGLFTIVLRSHSRDNNYFLTTQNDGSDTVKSPMGLFEDLEIDNDLAAIDKKICEYYEIGEK